MKNVIFKLKSLDVKSLSDVSYTPHVMFTVL